MKTAHFVKLVGLFTESFDVVWDQGGEFSALLQGKLAGSGDTWQVGVNGFVYGVPAPGALALLGLAGIAGRRRRR